MLRILSQADLIPILAIEKSVHVVPWTEETFKLCFESGYFGWAIELEKEIIGFIFVSYSATECHVLNLCVSRAYQYQGWGRMLLDYAIHAAKQRGMDMVYLEVRRSNTRAISLYKKLKFQLIGERKGYYPTLFGNEDALIFARCLQI